MSILLFHRSIPLAYGALLLILALYKAREFWKLNGFTGSRLVVILIRDQALYYVACVLAIIVQESTDTFVTECCFAQSCSF